jgi:hypothetical protein
MRMISGFMFLIGVVLIFIFYKINLSYLEKGIILSLIIGIITFILISGLIYHRPRKIKNKNWYKEENIKKRKKKAHRIGFILMIIIILAFFNFYFYFKALIGNEMLISLDVNESNFIIKNMEEASFNVKVEVITNPFCSANCSIILEDLSENKILEYQEMYVKVPSPFSKDYFISSSQDKFGQKLYKITLKCNPVKEKRLCYIKSDLPKIRTSIISLEYNLNEIQNTTKNLLKKDSEEIIRKFYTTEYLLNNLEFNISSLNLSELEDESKLIKNNADLLSKGIDEIIYLYSEQEYSNLETKIPELNTSLLNFTNQVIKLNESLSKKVKDYNSLIENISLMYQEILFLEDSKFTNSSFIYAESFIRNFNLMIEQIKKKQEIETKIILFNMLNTEKDNLFSILEDENDSEILRDKKIKVSISPVNIQKIYLNNKDYSSNYNLKEPSPVCCFRKECYKCINDPSVNYPIILVHGHSFNEKLSAELSMESFSDMAQYFEKDGYLDAGYFYRGKYKNSQESYLGKINTSLIIEATYYIDTASTEKDYFIYDSKWESIDTYSSRLNDIIEEVLYITGKEKAILVAHSMGSLVTRKYIQLYGEDNLEKVILIGGPNKGIDGLVLNSCAVFGADIECQEMNESSKFIKELNEFPAPNISVYNIIGLGCPFEGTNSDGIIKEESAYLEWANNIYVNGTCNGIDFFHVRMIKPTLHPEIYEIIKRIIEE